MLLRLWMKYCIFSTRISECTAGIPFRMISVRFAGIKEIMHNTCIPNMTFFFFYVNYTCRMTDQNTTSASDWPTSILDNTLWGSLSSSLQYHDPPMLYWYEPEGMYTWIDGKHAPCKVEPALWKNTRRTKERRQKTRLSSTLETAFRLNCREYSRSKAGT